MLSPDIVRPIPAVPETATLDVVLETLRDARAQMAVVIDEHGGTAGVLTHEDLFDEVIGEVAEGAADRTSIYRTADGVLARERHLTRRGGRRGARRVALEHDEVDSVSGLILTLLGTAAARRRRRHLRPRAVRGGVDRGARRQGVHRRSRGDGRYHGRVACRRRALDARATARPQTKTARFPSILAGGRRGGNRARVGAGGSGTAERVRRRCAT